MEANEAKVQRYWRELWTEGRMEYAEEFYAPTYRENHDEASPAAFAIRAARWRDHFDGFNVTVDELFTVGHRVISRVTYRGRHTGDFSWFPASGRSYELTGIDIFEFVDGRVVQHWHETDHLAMFEQLGAELVPSRTA